MRASEPAPLISPEEVYGRVFDTSQSFILLDVRTPMEWLFDGYIEGALRIPLDELETRLDSDLPKDSEIIIYCAHGIRSANVAAFLKLNGWPNVKDMQGGIDLWKRLRLPVVRN